MHQDRRRAWARAVLVLTAVAALLLLVAVGATLLPAARALRRSPLQSIRGP